MLYAYPMDLYGVGHYRVIWPLAEISDRVEYTLVKPGEDGGLGARVHPVTGRPVEVVIPDDCSCVLMQRPTNEVLVSCIPLIQALGVPVLVDVDDDLSALSPQHPAFRHLHPRMSGRLPGHSQQAVRDACLAADLVIASTPALLERYAPHKRGVVLRNRLRSDWAASLREGEGGARSDPPHTEPRVSPPRGLVPRLGWPGSLDSHPADLQIIGNAVARASQHFRQGDNTVFHVLGPPPSYVSANPLGVPTRFTGAVDFHSWLPAIHEHLDIGVAPLEPTPFNRAKSYIKPLELAAAHIPVVRSKTPEYDHLQVGLAAETPKEWRRALTKLAQDEDFRTELAAHDAALARSNTYARHADEWAEVFQTYVNRPRTFRARCLNCSTTVEAATDRERAQLALDHDREVHRTMSPTDHRWTMSVPT